VATRPLDESFKRARIHRIGDVEWLVEAHPSPDANGREELEGSEGYEGSEETQL
jgi:hypothetical protein